MATGESAKRVRSVPGIEVQQTPLKVRCPGVTSLL